MADIDRGSRKYAVALIVAQLAAATGDGVAFYPVAESSGWSQAPKKRLNAEMDRIHCPPELRKAIPVVKVGSALGLMLGLRQRGLGRLTAFMTVVYFVVALGFHARAKDPISKFVPATFMLIWSLLALRDISAEPV